MTEESQFEYWNNKFKEVKPLVLSVNYTLLKNRIRDVKDRCTTRTVINQTRLLIGFGVWCEKPIKKLVKADMDNYFDTLEGQADVTISTTKQVIKSFLKTVNPKVAVTIKPKKIKNKLTPDSLLTDTDISKMIKAAPNLRDKAFLACLWDSGARKGELTSTTIADAKFDKYGCMLWLRKGKTGARPARLVFASSYLSDWLDAHPTKEKKNSPIFCSLQEPYNLISDNGIYEQLKRLAKKAGVTKRVNCHNWRHTRATDLAKKITEQQMKAVLGWSAGSVQTQTYVHLSAQDVNDAMLEASGIEVDKEDEEISLLPMIDKLWGQGKGTLVLWNRLDKIKVGEITLEQALGNRMEEVKEHLELVFHRYLSGDGVGKVSITINGNKLIPFDPFYASKSSIVMDDEKIELPERKGKVVVRPFILPHPSKMTKEELEKYGGKDGLRKLQGFYIYRNKRLLTWGTWFRLIKMDEFSKLARVRVDIPNSLDDLWTLDIKKSTAYPPEIVKTRLKQIVGTISNSSRKTWTFRRRKEIDDNIAHIWNRMEAREGIRYFINQDHPLLDLINEQIDDTTRKLLCEYLETVQNNLPINTLHNDIHNEVKIARDQEKVEQKRVCEMARKLLKNAKSVGELDKVYDKFEIVEPFNDYLVEIKEIYMEVKGND